MHPKKITRLNQQFSHKTTAKLRYTISALNPDGTEDNKRDWVENLILDQGLNQISGQSWCDSFTNCYLGNPISPTPVRRDSNAITLTQSGNTVLASGSFFVSADEGRLLKYNDIPGTEVYITHFTSSTVVTVGGPSFTLALPTTGTVWYVNETALDQIYVSTVSPLGFSYGTDGGDNGTSFSGNVVTHKRTYVFNALSGSVTFTELGFGPSQALWDRDVITGGISMTAGQQPKVVAEVIVTFTPNTPSTVSNVGTGINTAGTSQIESLFTQAGISKVNTNGTTLNGDFNFLVLELVNTGSSQLSAMGATFTLQTLSTGSAPALPGSTTSISPSTGGYTNGNFNRDITATFSVGQANGTIYGFCLGAFGGRYFTLLFTNPQTKTSSQTLAVTFNFSWQRILVN